MSNWSSQACIRTRLGSWVSEEALGLEAGGDASTGVDPAAISIGLGAAANSERVAAKAEAYLEAQRRLSDDQRRHLHEQLKSLRLSIWQQILAVLLRIAMAFIGAAIAAALAWFIWKATNSNALVMDAFAVPPDLAARGLSGPVVAAKLSDKITAMQAETSSQRPPKSYANGLADGLKLEIPETGVSLSELDRFLREKLGRDLHIGGEMVLTGNRVALTARVGSDGSATVTGTEAGMDALLQKLAEQVYRITQPYRYSVWLRAHDRI